MSKASRIRELYAQGLGTGEIAKIVGCSKEYVRVAGRQRGGGRSYSDADVRYLTKRYGGTIQDAWREMARARYADPVKYARHQENVRAYLARQANHR